MPVPNKPRLYLDEHMSKRLARQVRRHDIDITFTQEMGMMKASDKEQLAFAVTQQRAIVTSDFGDYNRLHKEYLLAESEHWGIILTDQAPINILTSRLVALSIMFTADELKNQLLWINDFEKLL